MSEFVGSDYMQAVLTNGVLQAEIDRLETQLINQETRIIQTENSNTELLEVCKMLVEWFDLESYINGTQFEIEMYDMAVAAIEKAQAGVNHETIQI